jgi:hypothetical protein
MKKYKGYYIDHVYFNSEAEIDEFIKNGMIERFKAACQCFATFADMEHSILCDEYAEQLHKMGLDWAEIEAIEIETYKVA